MGKLLELVLQIILRILEMIRKSGKSDTEEESKSVTYSDDTDQVIHIAKRLLKDRKKMEDMTDLEIRMMRSRIAELEEQVLMMSIRTKSDTECSGDGECKKCKLYQRATRIRKQKITKIHRVAGVRNKYLTNIMCSKKTGLSRNK